MIFGKVLELNTASVPTKDLKIVYSAMHGVGTEWSPGCLPEAGYSAVSLVEEQCKPDPDFPP